MRTVTELYKAFRADGHQPSVALHYAKREPASRDVLTETGDTDDAPYECPLLAYDVDTDALARRTADWPDPVVAPAGATVRVFVYDDLSPSIDDVDAEVYDDEARAAYAVGRWTYVGVSVVVTLADGRRGLAECWGFELGDYWPGSEDAQVYDYAASDMISEAVRIAESETYKPTTVAETLDVITGTLPDGQVFRAADGSAVVIDGDSIVFVGQDGSTCSATMSDTETGWDA